MTIHTFPCAIYKPRILFPTTRPEWAAIVKQYGKDFAHPLAGGHGSPAAVVRLDVAGYSPVLVIVANRAALRRLGPAVIAETCAHEATHVMRYICENIGEPFMGWEAEAHLVGAVAKWMFEIIVDGRVKSDA